MKKHVLLKGWVLVAIDILLIGAVLCGFCYFHHVREFWVIDMPSDGEQTTETTTLKVFTKPVKTTTTPSVGPGTDNKDPVIGTGTGDGTGTGSPDEPVTPPVILDQGDFGASFPEKFLPEGESIVTENSYISHDINITYERKTIPSGKSQIVYYYYDIYIRNIENFYTASTKGGTRQYLDTIESYVPDMLDAEGNQMYDTLPVLSMNGDLYKYNDWPVAVRNGTPYCEGKPVYELAKYITADIGVLYWDGSFEVISIADYDWEKVTQKGPYQIWHFGPGLLDGNGNTRGSSKDDYKYDGASSNGIVGGGNPRAAIGYYEPGHYCFVVVDGRSAEYVNINIPRLAQIMSDLGCKQAYNLDGGNTAQVKFNGVYQRKSDPNASQRKVDDILCIGEVAKRED